MPSDKPATITGRESNAADGEALNYKGDQTPPQFVTEFHPSDVFTGRGGPMIGSQGNIQFRRIIQSRRKEIYNAERCKRKSAIAKEILDEVHHRGGRFLRKLETVTHVEELGIRGGHDSWVVITDNDAIKKIKQALRHKDGNRSLSAKSSQATKRTEAAPLAPATDAAIPMALPPLSGARAYVAGGTQSQQEIHPAPSQQQQVVMNGAPMPFVGVAGLAVPIQATTGCGFAMSQLWNQQAMASNPNLPYSTLALSRQNCPVDNSIFRPLPLVQLLQELQKQDQEHQLSAGISNLKQRRQQVQVQRHIVQAQATSLLMSLPHTSRQTPNTNAWRNASLALNAPAISNMPSTVLARPNTELDYGTQLSHQNQRHGATASMSSASTDQESSRDKPLRRSGDRGSSHPLQIEIPVRNSNHGQTQGIAAALTAVAAQAAATEADSKTASASRLQK